MTWTRNGAGCEVQQVTFEQSPDGTNYLSLGHAEWITNGWQLGGLALPIGQNLYVRARGRTVGGQRNGSSGLLESVAQFYLIPRPQLVVVPGAPPGTFQFAFTNSTSVGWSVLATTNAASTVANWENLGPPVSVGNGLYQFTDPGATNHAQRFYQLRSP